VSGWYESCRGPSRPLVGLQRGAYNAVMTRDIREPIVAGAFYPEEAASLRAMLAAVGTPVECPGKPLDQPVGLVAPHAGYAYSGRTAAMGFGRAAALGIPGTVLVLGANHTGIGTSVVLDDHDGWATPLGIVPVDRTSVEELASAGLVVDRAAFAREHSVEVQLPFIQTFWGGKVPIVPVSVQMDSVNALHSAAEAFLALSAVRPTLVVASSDFTHYEPESVARAKDLAAIELILSMASEPFLRHVATERPTICGTGAIALLMMICSAMGCNGTELVHYTTSAESTGDRSAVVGYASILLFGGDHD